MGRKKLSKEEKKPILTISINENLLNKIDELIKKKGGKRSLLIEELLIKYVEENKNKLQ
jgi:metal-responsive CopG/Arc/MetJ family transcriptional regulator